MYEDPIVTLRVDLNRLKGNRLRTPLRYVGGTSRISPLRRGEVVRVVEEEGDLYLAVVEEVRGDRVDLEIDLSSLVPAQSFQWDSPATMDRSRTQVLKRVA